MDNRTENDMPNSSTLTEVNRILDIYSRRQEVLTMYNPVIIVSNELNTLLSMFY